MLIDKDEFDFEMHNPRGRTLTLVMIGMSETGKSYWSREISGKFGFNHIEFDELIARDPEFMKNIDGMPGDEVDRMGDYFGMPWEIGFKGKEKLYLGIERRIMASDHLPDSVLDLSGSCIYHPDEMESLKKKGLMIYLEDGMDIESRVQRYMEKPKPICWNGGFERVDGEENIEALKRCFPKLISVRRALYESYADVIVPPERRDGDAENFFRLVRERLPGHI